MKYLSLLFLLFCISCATAPLKKFPSISVGMDKGEVLEALGSPLHVNQKTKNHIWHYRFFDKDENEIMKEIKFSNGKVVYAVDVKHPAKIYNPRGSSYTQEDLEDYLKKEKQKSKTVKKPDTHDMEKEMLEDLGTQGDFVPVND